MMNVISLIRENHISFIQLYHKELEQKDVGVLLFKVKDDTESVDVSYYPLESIKSTYIVQRMRAMVLELDNGKKELKLNNRMIVTLPMFESLPDGVTTLGPMFFVIMAGTMGRIFQLIPQTTTIAGKEKIYYQMIADPTPEEMTAEMNAKNNASVSDADKKTVINGWTKENTHIGRMYIHACQVALMEPKLFKKLRSCREFREVIGCEDEAYGERLARIVVTEFTQLVGPEFGKNIHDYKELDKICGPNKYYYVDIGWEMNPTTLRYMVTYLDIGKHFGDFTNSSIIEIGCGYGGLCSVINISDKIKRYTAIEIEPIRSVADKYLQEAFGADKEREVCLEVVTPDAVVVGEGWDILISQLAFSELTEEVMQWYLDNIFVHVRNTVYLELDILEDARREWMMNRIRLHFPNIIEYTVTPEHETWKRYVWVASRN